MASLHLNLHVVAEASLVEAVATAEAYHIALLGAQADRTFLFSIMRIGRSSLLRMGH